MSITLKSCLLRSGLDYRIRWIPEYHADLGSIELEDRKWYVILVYSAKRKFEWKEGK